MLLNFVILKAFPPSPTRVWRKKIGPDEERRTATATAMNRGLSKSRPDAETAMSSARLRSSWRPRRTGRFNDTSGAPLLHTVCHSRPARANERARA
jgi:hypothetical protein